MGVAGTQLLGDILAGSVTGGGALLPMAVRSFGSSAQTARQSGADLGQQLLYGTGSAALSVATEKISNVAAPFKAAFGAGVLDDALSRLPASPMTAELSPSTKTRNFFQTRYMMG